MEIENSPMDVTPPGGEMEYSFRHLPDTDTRQALQEVQRNIFVDSPEASLTLKPSAGAANNAPTGVPPSIIAPPPTASMALLDSPELFAPVTTSRAQNRGFGGPGGAMMGHHHASSRGGALGSSLSASTKSLAASDWERFCESRAGDVLLWRNPALTGLSFFGGSLAVLAIHFVLHGDHGHTWLTVGSYICCALAAANFLRGLVSSRERSLAESQLAAAAAAKAADAVLLLARMHDRLLASSDPFLTLKVAAVLWFLATVGRVASPWTLVTAAFFAAYTLPAAYHRYRPQVDGAVRGLAVAAQNRWSALGLSRKQQAAVLGVGTLVLWLHCSWGTRMMSLFVGLVTVRCNLRQAEVEAILSTAEPYTQSVKKRARRLSVAATDFARRSLAVKPSAHKPHMR